jgi:hypothetical protein
MSGSRHELRAPKHPHLPLPPLRVQRSRTGVSPSQQHVLRPLASGEQRQRFAGDPGLEVRALLMRLPAAAEVCVRKSLTTVR